MAVGGLDADDLDAGLDRLGGNRRARDEPAAADRNDQGIELGHLLEHFQRDGAVAHRDTMLHSEQSRDPPFELLAVVLYQNQREIDARAAMARG